MTNTVTSRTPLRISFFGGGTDFPEWYLENGGAVLSTTINKYCHIVCVPSYPFHNYQYRIVYSDIEVADRVEDIKHPAVREILKAYREIKNIEIHYSGDLPAGTGLGASSAFSVGMIKALEKFNGREIKKKDLAQSAIYFEREKMKEVVGCQDQIATAYGGFNKIQFNSNGQFDVQKIEISKKRQLHLQNHLMLFYSGIKRISSTVASSLIKKMPDINSQLSDMRELVDEGLSVLCNESCDINEFGKLLNTNWQIKRSLSEKVSHPTIDDMYDKAIQAGALGGKVLGAGGGGFLLLFVEPHKQEEVTSSLHGFKKVNFSFEEKGSQVFEQVQKKTNNSYMSF